MKLSNLKIGASHKVKAQSREMDILHDLVDTVEGLVSKAEKIAKAKPGLGIFDDGVVITQGKEAEYKELRKKFLWEVQKKASMLF